MKRSQPPPPGKPQDLVERLLENDPGFARLLEQRLRERTISVEAASRRLAARSRRRKVHGK